MQGLNKIRLIAVLMMSLLVASTAWSGPSEKCEDKEAFPLITKKELQEVVKSRSAMIVDVNSAESFEKEHVPGAVHYGKYKKDFVHMLPTDKSKLIVAYCGGVQCSAWHAAAKIACEHGYTNVRHYKEGIKGWVAKD